MTNARDPASRLPLTALRARGLWQGVPYPGEPERIAELLGEAKKLG